MTKGGGRDWRGIGCAAVIGASLAFPIGILVGVGRPSAGGPAYAVPGVSAKGEAATRRNPYSPRILDDPAVIEEQSRLVEALEMSCRQFQLHCAEAEQARLRIEEAKAGK